MMAGQGRYDPFCVPPRLENFGVGTNKSPPRKYGFDRRQEVAVDKGLMKVADHVYVESRLYDFGRIVLGKEKELRLGGYLSYLLGSAYAVQFRQINIKQNQIWLQ